MAEFTGDKKSNEDVTDCSSIMQGTEADKAADFANYFCSYAYLYHQKQMLMDHVRMRAYHSAIMSNKDLFKDKVILDVGAGSGILSIWAAQAGAAKVYAVEFTDCAKHARVRLRNTSFLGAATILHHASLPLCSLSVCLYLSNSLSVSVYLYHCLSEGSGGVQRLV